MLQQDTLYIIYISNMTKPENSINEAKTPRCFVSFLHLGKPKSKQLGVPHIIIISPLTRGERRILKVMLKD